MKPRNPWLVWLLVTVVSFALLESRALRTHTIPTLSETLAGWWGTYPRRKHGSFVPLVFLGFWVWVTVHVLRWESKDV
jgi:hypothetical protein